MIPARYRKEAPVNQKELKEYIRNQLTDCTVRLSSTNFEKELVEFLSDRNINNVTQIRVKTKNVSIVIDYGDNEVMMIIGRNLFE